MMKKSLFFMIFLSTTQAWANSDITTFIPKGFVLQEQHCQADFNQDGKKDCVLLIKNTLKSAWEQHAFNGEMVDRNRRGLIILFKTNKGYQKILENKALFASENEDGGIYFAPELIIETKQHKLILHYGHGRYGDWQYFFDYHRVNNQSDFYLIGYDRSVNFGAYIYEMHSVNFLTNKYRHQENMQKDRDHDEPNFKTTWYTLPKQPLLDLKQLADIDEFGDNLNRQ